MPTIIVRPIELGGTTIVPDGEKGGPLEIEKDQPPVILFPTDHGEGLGHNIRVNSEHKPIVGPDNPVVHVGGTIFAYVDQDIANSAANRIIEVK